MRESDWALFVAIHGAVVAAFLALRFARGRGLAEVRIRLLEALAAAARRGVPLAPLVDAAARERRFSRRVVLGRLAAEIECGTPLADALEECRALRFSRAHVAAIRAADGTPHLADALASAARDETTARTRRHRIRGAVAYPLLVLVAVLPFTRGAGTRLDDIFASTEVERPGAAWTAWLDVGRVPAPPVQVVGWALLAVTGYWLVRRFVATWRPLGRTVLPAWTVVGMVPPFRGPSRLAAGAAFLDSVAGQVRGGRPLGEASRAAALASRNLGIRRGALRFATAVESGAPADEAWDLVPLPVSIRPRAAHALSRPDAPARLERLAAECRSRHDVAVERRVRWLGPAALLLVGLAITSIAVSFFEAQGALLRLLAEGPSW